MTRAAEALGLTQSAASAAIAALEDRHGVRLFDRVGRGLALTEAGRVFVPEARAVLLRARAAEQALIDLAGLRRGELSLAASQTISSYWLPSQLAGFAEAYPGIELKVEAGNTSEVARLVADGDAELGFVEGAVEDLRLMRRQVGGDRIALYAAPANPLLGRSLGDAELQHARWVLREQGSGTRAHFEQMIARRDLSVGDLEVALVLPSNEAVLSAAAGGALVGAVSELAALPFVTAGRVVRLPVELGERQFDMLWHKERRLSAAARAFVDRLPAPTAPPTRGARQSLSAG